MGLRVSAALLLAASAAALTACGSSRNSAPIVYGTNPAATGRIYNAPTESRAAAPSYLAQAPQQPAYRAPSYQPPAQTQPARLTPVTADALQPAPQAAHVSSYETAKSPPANTLTNGALLVSVRPGDTVYAISRRTGASPQAIIAENNLRAPYTLNVGETLRIPDPSRKIVNELAAPAPQPAYASAPSRSSARVVRPGETLYSISRATGASVPAIAEANRLRAPYTLSVGQQLVIPGATGESAPRQREANMDVGDIARSVSYTKPAPASSPAMFDWPVKGAIIAEFGSAGVGRRNDGVNIAAPVGTPVRAAADGEVVYRGSELDGYGNLLLIKHADGFVTAYAHNDTMLARKGQKVQKGQVIAKVGQTGSVTEPQLHFEIRQNLKSVDPLALLQ